MESGSGPKRRFDVEVLTHPPDPLTHASHLREVDSGWLPFPIVLPLRLGSRGRTDEGMRITIPHEGFNEVVLLLSEVLSLHLEKGNATVVMERETTTGSYSTTPLPTANYQRTPRPLKSQR